MVRFRYFFSASCDARMGATCYVLVRDTLNVAGARNRCHQYGGHLVVIDNAEENSLVQQIAHG